MMGTNRSEIVTRSRAKQTNTTAITEKQFSPKSSGKRKRGRLLFPSKCSDWALPSMISAYASLVWRRQWHRCRSFGPSNPQSRKTCPSWAKVAAGASRATADDSVALSANLHRWATPSRWDSSKPYFTRHLQRSATPFCRWLLLLAGWLRSVRFTFSTSCYICG